nr:uncharacterized protein LOC112931159 [Vulpes vulpes]
MNDSDSERRKRMTTVNLRYVLKNWMAESTVRKAERNDFSEKILTVTEVEMENISKINNTVRRPTLKGIKRSSML